MIITNTIYQHCQEFLIIQHNFIINQKEDQLPSPCLADIFRHLAGRRLRSRDSSGHCPRHSHHYTVTRTQLVTQARETGAVVFCNIRNYTSLSRYISTSGNGYLIREVWHACPCEVAFKTDKLPNGRNFMMNSKSNLFGG